jgi:hypothetical protein
LSRRITEHTVEPDGEERPEQKSQYNIGFVSRDRIDGREELVKEEDAEHDGEGDKDNQRPLGPFCGGCIEVHIDIANSKPSSSWWNIYVDQALVNEERKNG